MMRTKNKKVKFIKIVINVIYDRKLITKGIFYISKMTNILRDKS